MSRKILLFVFALLSACNRSEHITPVYDDNVIEQTSRTNQIFVLCEDKDQQYDSGIISAASMALEANNATNCKFTFSSDVNSMQDMISNKRLYAIVVFDESFDKLLSKVKHNDMTQMPVTVVVSPVKPATSGSIWVKTEDIHYNISLLTRIMIASGTRKFLFLLNDPKLIESIKSSLSVNKKADIFFDIASPNQISKAKKSNYDLIVFDSVKSMAKINNAATAALTSSNCTLSEVISKNASYFISKNLDELRKFTLTYKNRFNREPTLIDAISFEVFNSLVSGIKKDNSALGYLSISASEPALYRIKNGVITQMGY